MGVWADLEDPVASVVDGDLDFRGEDLSRVVGGNDDAGAILPTELVTSGLRGIEWISADSAPVNNNSKLFKS